MYNLLKIYSALVAEKALLKISYNNPQLNIRGVCSGIKI